MGLGGDSKRVLSSGAGPRASLKKEQNLAVPQPFTAGTAPVTTAMQERPLGTPPLTKDSWTKAAMLTQLPWSLTNQSPILLYPVSFAF